VQIKKFLVVIIMLFWAHSAYAIGLGVTGKASSLGIGIEVTKSLVPMVNIRGGVNFFNYTFNRTKSGNDYDFDLKLKSFSILVDLHPILGRGFRISGGVVFNDNHMEMLGLGGGSYSIGNQTYTAADIGVLRGTVDFKPFAPYLGIGWGNATSGRFGIAMDLGLAFQGSPQVALVASGPISSNPIFIQELNRENRELENDTREFKYYPVIGVGLSFNLGL
jgi:hypothetical protein